MSNHNKHGMVNVAKGDRVKTTLSGRETVHTVTERREANCLSFVQIAVTPRVPGSVGGWFCSSHFRSAP